MRQDEAHEVGAWPTSVASLKPSSSTACVRSPAALAAAKVKVLEVAPGSPTRRPAGPAAAKVKVLEVAPRVTDKAQIGYRRTKNSLFCRRPVKTITIVMVLSRPRTVISVELRVVVTVRVSRKRQMLRS